MFHYRTLSARTGKILFRHIISAAALLFAIDGYSQGVAINNDNSAPDASAMLDVKSSNKGVLIPRMSGTEISGIVNPAHGLLVYRADSPEGFYYNSGTTSSPIWTPLLSSLLTDSLVKLAPATQQSVSSTNTLINLKKIGGTGMGMSNVEPLLSLSASGTYPGNNTYDMERVRIDNDGAIVSIGQYNSGAGGAPAESSGVRFLWYPGKAAIRAGEINGTQWDDANIGSWSTAFGYNVRSSGDYGFSSGRNSTAANTSSTAMGEYCTASGIASVALGYYAHTNARQGSFVFSDRSVLDDNDPFTDEAFRASAHHTFNVRATGGYHLYTNTGISTGLRMHGTSNSSGSFVWTDRSSESSIIPAAANQTIFRSTGGFTIYTNSALSSGVSVSAGGGSWSSLSDRNMKENFTVVNGEDILHRLRNVPISTWNYKTQDAAIRHIGPMAQDFAQAFRLGEDDRHIATIDPDGIALAGIQALDNRTTDQQDRIGKLEKENEELRERLKRLEALLIRTQEQ